MHEPLFKIRVLRKARGEMSLQKILFPYPFISTDMKKEKLIILFKDSSEVFITHLLNTSRTALTAYQLICHLLSYSLPSGECV